MQVTEHGSLEFVLNSAKSSMNSAQFINNSAGYKNRPQIENRFYSELKRHDIPFKQGYNKDKI